MQKMIKKYILRIDSIAKKVIETTVIALFVVLILYLVYALLYASVISDTNLSINTTLRQIIKLIAIAMFVTFLIAVCIRLLLSPFVKPDEEADFERKVDYVLEHRKRQKEPAPSKATTKVAKAKEQIERALAARRWSTIAS